MSPTLSGPKNNEMLRQHNVLTEARYEMSALEKNIIYLLMASLEEGDESGKEYTIPVEALKIRIGNVSTKSLFDAVGNLLKRVYTITKENGNILCVTLITMGEYDNEDGLLRLKIAQKLHPYLVALKQDYTEFGLDMALSLRSKYAKRIYEMLSQHKEVGQFSITVEDLRHRLSLKNQKTGEEKLSNWTIFEKTVLQRSQEEIGAKTDISFSYTLETLQKQKKYTAIHFKIQRNPVQLSMRL